MSYLLLVINPGSTSTKVAVFKGHEEIVQTNISHSAEELSPFNGVIDQMEFRYQKIEDFIKKNNYTITDFKAVVARGGLLKPIPSGTYEVDIRMIKDLQSEKYGTHAANLGALIAVNFAKQADISAFVVDPVVVDELAEVARFTGRPEFQRRSLFHALNQKAVAKKYAAQVGKKYEDVNLIIAHMGGGISIGAHQKGKVIEVSNAIDGEGPMSPERTGAVPAQPFAALILEKKWEMKEIEKALAGRGGLVAHLGTTDVRDVEKMISEGDQKAKLVLDSMLYQVARYIGAAAAVLKGQIDQIILTGGIAHSKYVVQTLKEYTGFLASITVYPGENELEALASGALRVLMGEEKAKEYK